MVEHWQQVKDLFGAAADLPASERPRFLDNACDGDTSLRAELERLLDADSKNGEGIVSAIESEARSLFASEGIVGSRIGAYRVVDEIGAGGMGTVYLAVRDDDQYRKKVAIKLIRRGMDTEDMLDRFRHERQILANLEHPYIARLFDGGSSPDGRPFLVMEYVEGEPLDVYCRTRDLPVRERCRLFLKVCEAVAYAHRNLVVHRDLKPGNVLVSADGSPKLLDFGVARLLDADAGSGRTVELALRPMTPDYASPEQVRAEPITTVSDIYSLGAILYELVSGQRPHRLASYGLREVERVICEVDPPRLSDGDLNAIVGKAMRKEPALRYATVERFAADLERYLNGWAVLARQGNIAYRTRKFARRHRMAIVAGAVLLYALVGGTTAAMIQAKRAERERARAEQEKGRAEQESRLAQESQARAEASRKDAERHAADAELQRLAAETQRQIADRRFEQVRQLAGKFLLDFHDAIARLPGATPARKMTVETGLKYFDLLVQEAHGNRELLEEVARGYVRLGDVQGNPYYANLGDLPGAMASYRKALAVRDRIADSSSSPELLGDRIRGIVKIAQLLSAQGDLQGADRTLRAAIGMGERHAAAERYEVRDALSNAYGTYGDLQIRIGDYSKCIEPYTRQLELNMRLEREQRNPLAERSAVALAHTKLGEALSRMQRGEEGLPHLRMALEIDQQAAAANPNNQPLQRKVLVDHFLLGSIFRTREQLAAPGEAQRVMETAVEMADRLAAADPANNTALMDIVSARTGLGDWLSRHGDIEGSLVHYRRVLEATNKMAGPPTLANDDAKAQAHHRLGIGLTLSGKLEEAMDHYRQAEEFLVRAEKAAPGSPRFARRHGEIAEGRAEVHKQQKNFAGAIADYRVIIGILEELTRRDPNSERDRNGQPLLYEKLADCYAALGQWSEAVRAIETALDRLQQIAARRKLQPYEEEGRQADLAKLAEWKGK